MRNNLIILTVAAATMALAGGAKQEAQQKLVGKPAPTLQVDHWLNTKGPLSLASLKGKVVVLDFWAYW